MNFIFNTANIVVAFVLSTAFFTLAKSSYYSDPVISNSDPFLEASGAYAIVLGIVVCIAYFLMLKNNGKGLAFLVAAAAGIAFNLTVPFELFYG